jgi:hypothetical protein
MLTIDLLHGLLAFLQESHPICISLDHRYALHIELESLMIRRYCVSFLPPSIGHRPKV